MLPDNFGEDIIKNLEHIAELPSVERGLHKVAEQAIEGIGEEIHSILDIDHDGSITDTIPDLIKMGMDVISSFFE